MPKVYTAIGTDLTNSFVDLSGITLPPYTSKFNATRLNSTSGYVDRQGQGRRRSEDALSISSTSSRSGNTSNSDTCGSDCDDEEDEGHRRVGRLRGGEGDGPEWGEEQQTDTEVEALDPSNPYNLLLKATNGELNQIQTAYLTHRTARNHLSRTTILAPQFPGPTIDPLLTAVVSASPTRTDLIESDTVDPRHCLVIWARPPPHVKRLLQEIQSRLTSSLKGVPFAEIWVMPQERLHITVLEVTHSTTPDAVDGLVDKIGREGFRELVGLPRGKGVRLGVPFLSYDKAALAVSFIPVGGDAEVEGDSSTADKQTVHTYHHLRRDVFDKIRSHGIDVDSRYVVPSAHITIARFITPPGIPTGGGDHLAVEIPELMQKWVEAIDGVNEWLATSGAVEEFLRGSADGCSGEGRDGTWGITELVPRRGRLWYGGGENVVI